MPTAPRLTASFPTSARALVGTFALGGPRFLTPEQADRIRTRPDEHFRQKMLAGENPLDASAPPSVPQK